MAEREQANDEAALVLQELLPISSLSLLAVYTANEGPTVLKSPTKVGQPQIIVLMINTLRRRFNRVWWEFINGIKTCSRSLC